MSNERLTANDTLRDCIVKMCDGNPGALMALGSLAEVSERIDPESGFGAFTGLLNLDSNGIYGTDIYILYQDICEGNPAHVLAVLRAVQLGLFAKETLQDACGRQDYSGKDIVPVKELYDMVRLELAGFDPDRVGEKE